MPRVSAKPAIDRARVFFALWPDAETAARLHACAVSAHGRFGGRAMRLDTLHLTVAFIGDVARSRLPDLQELAGQVDAPCVDLTLDVLGEWERKHIVWAGPSTTPDALLQLVEALGGRLKSAGFDLEARSFVPHVTLLRNARCTDQRTPLEASLRWHCDGFVLVESTLGPAGSRYEILAQQALSRP